MSVCNPELPPEFRHTITTAFAAGAAWLAGLPLLLRTCAERYELQLEAPFPNLSYNYVAPARRADGTAVVLKVGVPRPELTNEIAALRHCAGSGCVRLLAADPACGMVLLERLIPGDDLTALADDAQANAIAAAAMRQFWRPPPVNHAFPDLATWMAELWDIRPTLGSSGPFPAHLVAAAEGWLTELLADPPAPVLLHGDLHHTNILRSDHTWVIIDPKGVCGEPTFELGTWLRNPVGLHTWPDLATTLRRRIDQLADLLVLDRERIRGWAIAQTVLSAWWNFPDLPWQPELAIAETLLALR